VANIKSQKKRNLTNAKRAARNKAAKSELKTRVKTAVRIAQSTGETDGDDADVRLAIKKLDKAAAKGIIHPNQAARRKSRLMAKVNAAG
jgi:small subunit ribosomal protein S20